MSGLSAEIAARESVGIHRPGVGAARLAESRGAAIETEVAGAAAPVRAGEHRRFVAGLWVTAAGTLASRLLGLVRDIATAALLGMGESGVMDAFVVAFRVPNLFRRLFGEGALAACTLPVLTEKLAHDRAGAWRLASVLLTWLAIGLAAIVVAGEACCAASWWLWAGDPAMQLIVGLTAALLPYVWFICLSAQLATTLQASSRFAFPALGPVVLNACWIGGAWWVAPRVSADPRQQAFVLAGCILLAGGLQMTLQGWALLRCGFRFSYRVRACRAELAHVGRSLGPMLAGLGVVQLNTLSDSLIAWLLAMPPDHQGGIWWLGGAVRYPLTSGAAAAIYYGERFYQLPVGLVGAAVATAIFPLLSRHAADRRTDDAARDLAEGVRLVWFASLPMAALLVLLAEPLVRLCFQRGHFSPADTLRTAHMVAGYATGVWAYCSIPVLVRGFYAWGDYRTPVRVAALAVGLNLALNLTLIWPLAEAGLAVATSLAATLQCLVLAGILRRKYCAGRLPLAAGLARSLAPTAALAVTVLALDSRLAAAADPAQELARVCGLTACGAAAFFGSAWLLGSRELTILLRREA